MEPAGEPKGTSLKDKLLVFVNSKSGGRQGNTLLPKFRELLPKDQVVDLLNEPDGPRTVYLYVAPYVFSFFLKKKP